MCYTANFRFRRLRNVHTEIVNMVLELVNLDVLKEVNKWKEILTRIRSKVCSTLTLSIAFSFCITRRKTVNYQKSLHLPHTSDRYS